MGRGLPYLMSALLGSRDANTLPVQQAVAETQVQAPVQRLLTNLQRRTIPGLDGIRGISALCVVAFHGWTERFPGRLAVQAFFVISGLLITWLLLQEEQKKGAVSRKAFYVRRAFRLLPALFLLLAWELFTDFPHAPLGGIIASAFYFANYHVIFGGQLISLAHTWSLAIEEHFYLIWPQVFVFVRNRAHLMWSCFAIAALEFIWRLYASAHIGYYYGTLATETTSSAVLLGCGLALLLWHSPKLLPGFVLRPFLAPVSLIILLLLAQLPEHVQWIYAVTACAPFAAIIVLQAVTYEWRILENSVARYLGRISYGIYLWGFVAKAIINLHWRVNNPAFLFMVVVALASISHFCVERPMQALGRKLLHAMA
jgi:peptidoglycan/LPS O-acetylase OafA/YrhL